MSQLEGFNMWSRMMNCRYPMIQRGRPRLTTSGISKAVRHPSCARNRADKVGREYKIFTFSSEGRDNSEILYALTIDVARTCGYSDSLAFLRRYPVIQKLQCQPGEAEMLVEVGRVAGNMKHRMVTIVPIHNVFKLMGARIIKGTSGHV